MEAGHEGIDAEHMKLFELLDKLKRSLESKNVDLDAVSGGRELMYCETEHFANEEKIMDSFVYGDIVKHKLVRELVAME